MNSIGIAALILPFVFLTGFRIAKEYQRAVVFPARPPDFLSDQPSAFSPQPRRSWLIAER
jgi:hypothetical protein